MMKTTWVWVRKDLMQFRWWILGWIALSLLPIALDTFERPSVFPGSFAQVMETLLPWIQFLITLVFVPRLIQTDSWLGSRAFWMTRPISGGNLLRVKLLTLFIGWVAPILVAHLIQCIHLGFGWSPIGVSLAELFLKKAALILLLGGVASLTSGFGQYALFLVTGLIGSWLIAWLGMLGGEFFRIRAALQDDWQESIQWVRVSQENTGKITAALGEIGLGGLLLILGYRFRRVWMTRGFGIAIWVCLVLISTQWKKDWFSVPLDAGKISVQNLKVEVDPAQIKVESVNNDSGVGNAYYKVNAQISVSGGSSDIVFEPSLMTLKWQVKGSSKSEHQAPATPDIDIESKLRLPHFGYLLKELGEGTLLSDLKSKPKGKQLLFLSGDEFAEAKGKQLNIHGKTQALAMEYLKVAQIQARAGENWSGDKDAIRILKSEGEGPAGWRVLLQEHRLDLLMTPTEEVHFRFNPVTQSKRYWYALWNPEKRELLIPSFRSDDYDVSFFKEKTVLSQKTLQLDFDGPAREWYKNAELIRWNTRELGMVTLPIAVSAVLPEAQEK